MSHEHGDSLYKNSVHQVHILAKNATRGLDLQLEGKLAKMKCSLRVRFENKSKAATRMELAK